MERIGEHTLLFGCRNVERIVVIPPFFDILLRETNELTKLENHTFHLFISWRNLHEEILLPALAYHVAALEQDFQLHKNERIEQIVDSFRQLCKEVIKLQCSGVKAPIGYIHISMLRSSILEGTYTYLLEAYSDAWYWDPVECMGSFSAEWAFGRTPIVFELLQREGKKYMAAIHGGDLERMVMKETAVYFSQFVTAAARLAVPYIIELPEFHSLQKAAKLRIRIGEFKDISEDLYVEDQEERDLAEAKRLLSQKNGAVVAYENMRGLPLAGMKMEQLDLRYTDFSSSDCSGGKVSGCALIGTSWRGGLLQQTDFSGSLWCDTDFQGSDLRGARFHYCSGTGMEDELYRLPGLLGVNFRNCRLDDADFTHSRLYHADFKGASMQGARFFAVDRGKLKLSEAQAAAVEWVPNQQG